VSGSGGAIRQTLAGPFGRYVAGNAVSLTGTWMQRTAVGWLAWELTRSPAWVGTIAFLDLAPSLLVAPLAGALADRHDRRRLMAVAQCALAALAGVLAVLAAAGALSVAVLAASVAVHGLLVGLNQPARLAFIPSLVPDALLPTAVALNSTVFNASRFVGPALAGLLLAAFGPAPVFLANALSYLAFLLALRGLPGGAAEPARAATGGLGAEVAEGVRLVLAAGPLRNLFLPLAAAAVLVRPMGELLPAFAGGVLGRGPETLGLLSAAVGLGAGLAGFALARRPGRDLERAFRRGTLGSAAAVVLLALSPTLALALPAAALAGVALATAGVSAQTLAQRAAPDRLRGRVMSLYGVVLRSVPAAGGLALGLLAEVVGLRAALAAGAVALAAAWPFLATRSHRAAPAVDSGPARS
jgi:MFS family permease